MITVCMLPTDKVIFHQLYEQFPESITETDVESSFDGTSLLQVAIEISKLTLPIVASIWVAKFNKNNVIAIKDKNGREITAQIAKPLTLNEVKELLKVNQDDDA